MRHIYKIPFAFLSLIIFTNSQGYAQTTTKQLFAKTYDVTKGTTLDLDNSFGNMNISLWNKAAFSIIVELKLEGFSEKETGKLLEKLNIEDEVSASEISIRTNWNNNNISSNGKKSFEVNYTVKVPDSHQLKLENSFGNLSIPDYNGKLDLEVEYGNLNAGKLDEVDIELSFGSGTIDAINKGELEIKYANKVEINELGIVDLETGFSKVFIKKANRIELEGKYGELVIDEINEILGSSSFSTFIIGVLNNKADLEVKYVSGKLRIDHISSDFKAIAIDSKFSRIELNFDQPANFNFHTEHKFGKLNRNNDNLNFTLTHVEDFSEEYKGYVGNQNSSAAEVYIATSYGDASLKNN